MTSLERLQYAQAGLGTALVGTEHNWGLPLASRGHASAMTQLSSHPMTLGLQALMSVLQSMPSWS
jgi:hypothetical protein